eukprot:6191931-Pleurochrysis_carterae.AAC.4
MKNSDAATTGDLDLADRKLQSFRAVLSACACNTKDRRPPKSAEYDVMDQTDSHSQRASARLGVCLQELHFECDHVAAVVIACVAARLALDRRREERALAVAHRAHRLLPAAERHSRSIITLTAAAEALLIPSESVGAQPVREAASADERTVLRDGEHADGDGVDAARLERAEGRRAHDPLGHAREHLQPTQPLARRVQQRRRRVHIVALSVNAARLSRRAAQMTI